MHGDRRPRSFYFLAAFFALFVLFLYGPMMTIFILSFQGPQGGLTFPMNGVSTFWFSKLMEGVGVVDIWSAFRRSIRLGLVVMMVTVVFSVAAGLAYRTRFLGAGALFYIVVSSLIVPSIVVSLGIGLGFRLIDGQVMAYGEAREIAWIVEEFTTTMGIFTSAIGAHLTWTLPFGLLIMFAVFNRFDKAHEEAARDLGASGWQTLRHVILPIIAPSLIGVALFGFTLSYDELARSTQAAGDLNTLPLELQGLTTTVTTPEIYALGTLTTAVSFAVTVDDKGAESEGAAVTVSEEDTTDNAATFKIALSGTLPVGNSASVEVDGAAFPGTATGDDTPGSGDYNDTLFTEIIDADDGNPAGRTLDFLSQEMLREANTIAGKSLDAQISRQIVEIKGAIDRIKEQVQNVE